MSSLPHEPSSTQAHADTRWDRQGPNLTGVLAEAAGAYALWRATPSHDTVVWTSGTGYDLRITRANGADEKINVKRAWRDGAPAGTLFCAPLGDAALRGETALETFALVVIEHSAMSWHYEQRQDGTVTLQATALPAEIYLLPRDAATALHGEGLLGPHGSSKARWFVRETVLKPYAATIPSA